MDEQTIELVERARRGGAEAFGRLIDQFERPMLAIAYSVTGDAHLAGDAVQEAFLHAWRGLGRLRDAGRFATWMAGIARNCAIDQCRRRKVAGELPVTLPGAAADEPGFGLGRRELGERVMAAVRELDEISRAAVMLRYFEGLSSREIGSLLEMSAAAVDMRLSRAREALREKLSDEATERRSDGGEEKRHEGTEARRHEGSVG